MGGPQAKRSRDYPHFPRFHAREGSVKQMHALTPSYKYRIERRISIVLIRTNQHGWNCSKTGAFAKFIVYYSLDRTGFDRYDKLPTNLFGPSWDVRDNLSS